jgi:chorismate mutase
VPIRALRGATTVSSDTRESIHAAVVELLGVLLERNDVDHDDIISILFTATDDLHSAFPAAGAREFGLGDVPLLCARELDITGATARCIRLLMHLETSRPRSELRHVYLHDAVGLRDDLPH